VTLLIVFTAIAGMVLASPGMVPLPALIFGSFKAFSERLQRRRAFCNVRVDWHIIAPLVNNRQVSGGISGGIGIDRDHEKSWAYRSFRMTVAPTRVRVRECEVSNARRPPQQDRPTTRSRLRRSPH